MAAEAQAGELGYVVALLAAGVVAVPLFKRIGLGSVLGYLTAGVVIGPFGLGLFTSPQAILHVAELGVVMFLFVIGLEMQPSRLWNLRREILGLGALQVGVCGALLTGIGVLIGFSPGVAFVAGMGFVLTSTAIVMQILNERGDIATPPGQRVVSILLLEDLAIVPLLATIALMAPGGTSDPSGRWLAVGGALAAVAALVVVGRFLLNPLFRILAAVDAREVMTAAALLVVLGAALAMQLGGLSMAMGAFLAGVLLSESTFRHQLEADIEPFRGILLGLFFLGVGMALDLVVLSANWRIVAVAVVAYMLVKGAAIYLIARLLKSDHREAIDRAVLMAQGGEFAFVLYAAAAAAGIIDARLNAVLTSTVIVSMVATPLAMVLLKRLMPRAPAPSLDGIDVADGLTGSALIIGFGRFGQVVSQPLLLRGIDVSIIDNDVEMIRAAGDFGFKIYYGDGTRLDILEAAGCANARAVLVCIDNPAAALKIVEQIKERYPLTPVMVRSYDRETTLALVHAGADYEVRETLYSALAFSREALERLGVPESEAIEIMDDVNRRDRERLDLQIASGLYAGRELLKGNGPTPTPLATPRRPGRALNPEAANVLNRAIATVRRAARMRRRQRSREDAS